MSVSFDVTAADEALIKAVAERVRAIYVKQNQRRAFDPLQWRMDLTACHASGNPLRLADLLAADDFNFAHDVFGISRHLDRETGELRDWFSPRFAARAPADA